MASWQAHVAAQICKWVVKRPFTRSPTKETIRRVFNGARAPVPKGCTAHDEILGGVRGEWITADGVEPRGTMLYIHGGAFVACSPATHRPITGWFAKHGWRVFVADYRLAPEYRFPAQIEDCVAVYRELLNRSDPRQLVVVGDSAGGNLTLALCLSLRAAELPHPAAIALFSPVTDFSWSGASTTENDKRCAMFSKGVLPVGAKLYLGDHNPVDPLASPLFADFTGLPPMIFQASADEILRDDSVRVAAHARTASVDAEIRIWPVVPHVWQMLHRYVPEGRESLAEVNSFLRRHLPAEP